MLDTFASNGRFRVEEEVGASFVLKIDVEGMECDVLAGMTNVFWLKSKVKSVFMEREHVGSGPDTLRGKHLPPRHDALSTLQRSNRLQPKPKPVDIQSSLSYAESQR